MSNDHTRKVLEQIDEHCKKVGRDTFLSKVQAAAQSALCDFPTEQETQRFNKLGQTYFAQTRAVLEAGLVAPKFDNTMLVAFVNDLSWVVFTSQMIAAMMRDNDTGGGSGKTCVGKCSDEYDKCMNESGCTTSFFCLCCTPCSLQYGGCVARCTILGFGNGGILMA